MLIEDRVSYGTDVSICLRCICLCDTENRNYLFFVFTILFFPLSQCLRFLLMVSVRSKLTSIFGIVLLISVCCTCYSL